MPFGLPLERYPSFRVTGLSLKGMRMNHPCLACFWGPRTSPALPASSQCSKAAGKCHCPVPSTYTHSCSPWSVLCMAFLWLLSMTPVAWSTDCSLACWQVPWLFPYVFCLKEERGGRSGLCAFVSKTVKSLKLLK